jgi:hypothetical protein
VDKVAVLLRRQESNEGHLLVQISTHLQSNGRPTSFPASQPVTKWPLNSKGILEQELIDALQIRFKHAA